MNIKKTKIAACLLTTLAYSLSLDAFACSTRNDEHPTDEQLYKSASAVFVAHITKTEEKSSPVGGDKRLPWPIVEGNFKLIEILKGEPPADGKVKDLVFGPGNCSLGLFAGLDYVFFCPGRAE